MVAARLLLVDDHPMVRRGIAHVVANEPDLTVCGEAEDRNSALKAVAELKPDLMLVDISLRGTDGIDLVRDTCRRFPDVKSLVVSMHDEHLYAENAIAAGASGYIMKQASGAELIRAIREVLGGGIYLSEQMKARILRKVAGRREPPSASPMECLSKQELRVFELIGKGYHTQEIALEMKLSVKTVGSYRERIKDKLGLEDATELVQKATLWVRGG